jgi:hypothetical protein
VKKNAITLVSRPLEAEMYTIDTVQLTYEQSIEQHKCCPWVPCRLQKRPSRALESFVDEVVFHCRNSFIINSCNKGEITIFISSVRRRTYSHRYARVHLHHATESPGMLELVHTVRNIQ